MFLWQRWCVVKKKKKKAAFIIGGVTLSCPQMLLKQQAL